MSEFGPPGVLEIDPVVIDRNYLKRDNVISRFLLYNLTPAPVDLESEAIDALAFGGEESIVDVGAADGSLLSGMRARYHGGPLTGVEPNTNQFDNSSMAELDITMLEGRAHDLSALDSDSANILFAMFMLYHVPESLHPTVFSEFKRVLNDDGVFVMATSGEENKFRHRGFEEEVAQALNCQAPPAMNTGFTTEKASVELPKYFNHVWKGVQVSDMVIDDSYKVRCYLNSLRSLRDQFEPEPTETEFNQALDYIVKPTIDEAIHLKGAFTDVIRRSVLLGSARPLQPDSTFFYPLTDI